MATTADTQPQDIFLEDLMETVDKEKSILDAGDFDEEDAIEINYEDIL